MKNKTFKTENGRILRLLEEAGAGGEGVVYRAKDTGSGEAMAVKIFNARFKTAQTIERIRYLASLNLHQESPVIFAPFDTIVNGEVGHCASWADGMALVDQLQNPDFPLMLGLQTGLALAHGIAVMHSKQISHGDLHAENVKVNRNGDVLEVALVDVDNFTAPGLPEPQMIGQALYLAPEEREELDRGGNPTPSIGTDNFQLAILLHEILLLRHPAAGYDDDENRFAAAMSSGQWVQDRNRNFPDVAPRLGGYPVGVLSPEVEGLFRTAFSRNPKERPTANMWKEALARAINAIGVCPCCGVQFIVDSGKRACPVCKHGFPSLVLRVAGVPPIPLQSAAVVIGRHELNNAPKVSERHVIFRKIGPETHIESVGMNPTFRWAGSRWVQLPNNRPLLVKQGDRLRFADVEAEVA